VTIIALKILFYFIATPTIETPPIIETPPTIETPPATNADEEDRRVPVIQSKINFIF